MYHSLSSGFSVVSAMEYEKLSILNDNLKNKNESLR